MILSNFISDGFVIGINNITKLFNIASNTVKKITQFSRIDIQIIVPITIYINEMQSAISLNEAQPFLIIQNQNKIDMGKPINPKLIAQINGV